METNKEKEISAIKSLIEYNNDRVEGYEKAAAQIEQADLTRLFNKFKDQSVKFSRELNNHAISLGGEPVQNTTNSGKVFRAWMDVKAALTGNDRKAVLGACEFGEDVILKAYDEALQGSEITGDVRKLAEEHARQIRAAHNEIKNLRDVQIF